MENTQVFRKLHFIIKIKNVTDCPSLKWKTKKNSQKNSSFD